MTDMRANTRTFIIDDTRVYLTDDTTVADIEAQIGLADTQRLVFRDQDHEVLVPDQDQPVLDIIDQLTAIQIADTTWRPDTDSKDQPELRLPYDPGTDRDTDDDTGIFDD